MKNLLIIAMFPFGFMNAQMTAIPDVNFEYELIQQGYDTGVPDGFVPTINIATITTLNVNGSNISDLTGIQDFSALTTLECAINQLTSLNLSQNTFLTYLECSVNQLTNINLTQNTALTFISCYLNALTSIDISQNVELIELSCGTNQLVSLDVSQNINLENLNCFDNQISNLNLSQNSVLTDLWCSDNNLTELDVSSNSNLSYLRCDTNQLFCLNVANGNNLNFSRFSAVLNPNLSCIEVDDINWSSSNWTVTLGMIDVTASFSLNCTGACALGVEELKTKPRELLKICDLMGREMVPEKNKVLLYVYSDGTVERVFNLEK
ncbi:MAG: hypothetical protein COA33_004100 [Fluviicola sp.]|nr:hypothetical protein [Fluviicola sp.]